MANSDLGGILSPIVRLGASWLETCTSIRLRNNRRLNVACVVEMFVQIGRRKRRGRNNSFLRFLGEGVVHHVSTTWKKIDRPINRNRATPPPPPLFYRIIERMSQRSLTPPPSPSDLPYSRFRSEIIRNRERERETKRRGGGGGGGRGLKSHRSRLNNLHLPTRCANFGVKRSFDRYKPASKPASLLSAPLEPMIDHSFQPRLAVVSCNNKACTRGIGVWRKFNPHSWRSNRDWTRYGFDADNWRIRKERVEYYSRSS